MRNITLMIVAVILCFVIQQLIGQFFPWWFRPNLLIILVVFFNLFRGIRHALCVGFFAGTVMDAFSPDAFGINILCFMSCAYILTFLKMYIYNVGSPASRVMMVSLASILFVILQYSVRLFFVSIPLREVVVYVLLPEVIWTTVLARMVLKGFRECALRFFA